VNNLKEGGDKKKSQLAQFTRTERMFNFTDYTYQLSYIFDRSFLTYKGKYSNDVIHVNQKTYYKGVDKHYDVYK